MVDSLQSIHQRALHTVLFFDLFDQAITENELLRFMLGSRVSLSLLRRTVRSNPRLATDGHYVFLADRVALVALRRERERIAARLWERAYRYQRLFQALPFIDMVAVCNSLAMGAVDTESDIDLFVVTRPGRLFLGRTVMTFVLQILGLRRHRNKIAGRFCLSFFVTRDALDLSSIRIKDDVYMDYWLRTLRPVTGHEVYKEMIEINTARRERHSSVGNDGVLWNVVESLLRALQLPRIRRKTAQLKLKIPSAIIANNNMLKFHNDDIRQDVRERFAEKFN